jgi:hypothetical protein
MAVDENSPNEANGKMDGLRGHQIGGRKAQDETETIAHNPRNTVTIRDRQ